MTVAGIVLLLATVTSALLLSWFALPARARHHYTSA